MGSEQLIVTKLDDGTYVVAPRYKPAGTAVVDSFTGVIYEILNYSKPTFLPETLMHLTDLSKKEESIIRELRIILQNTSDRVRNLALEEGRISLERKVSDD